MSVDEIVNRLNTLAALGAGLLSVSVTLVALVPTLVQLVRARMPDFFSQIDQEGSLRRLMTVLAGTVIGFSISLGLALVGLFHVRPMWMWLSLAAFVITLLALVGTSVRAALTTRDIM